MSQPGQINQETATPEPTWTPIPTETPTPTITPTPTPVVVVYATVAPVPGGEGQASVFEYRATAGDLLIAMLLMISVVLNVFQMIQNERRTRG